MPSQTLPSAPTLKKRASVAGSIALPSWVTGPQRRATHPSTASSIPTDPPMKIQRMRPSRSGSDQAVQSRSGGQSQARIADSPLGTP